MTGHSGGVTLVELLVVLVVLGTMTSLVGSVWQPEAWLRRDSSGAGLPLQDLRRRALTSGRVVRDTLRLESKRLPVIAFPDGRVLGADDLGVDPLTGRRTP